MKFGFVAKHRGIWPVVLMCGALDVSRGGFYAWLGKQVKRSFVDSDRTYGARRVWHDVLAQGCDCGLHMETKFRIISSLANWALIECQAA